MSLERTEDRTRLALPYPPKRTVTFSWARQSIEHCTQFKVDEPYHTENGGGWCRSEVGHGTYSMRGNRFSMKTERRRARLRETEPTVNRPKHLRRTNRQVKLPSRFGFVAAVCWNCYA